MREIKCGWYSVYVTERPGVSPVVDVNKLADELPHGSGIDGNYYLSVNRNGDIRATGEYHGMNENGFYAGWYRFNFSIRRVRREPLTSNALYGPCLGQMQHSGRRGDIYLTGWSGGGNSGTLDYLAETVEHALHELVPGLTYWTTGERIATAVPHENGVNNETH